jgi:hypothetical protein
MTIPRFVVIAIACLVFFDMKYGSGRIVDSLEDQASRVGYRLNSEFDDLSRRIARFDWAQRGQAWPAPRLGYDIIRLNVERRVRLW